jgi:hypothetical protein
MISLKEKIVKYGTGTYRYLTHFCENYKQIQIKPRWGSVSGIIMQIWVCNTGQDHCIIKNLTLTVQN